MVIGSTIAAAAIGAAGAVGGAAIASSASKKAADAQKKAAKKAQSFQEQQYADLQPWRTAGEKALTPLTEMTLAGPGEFTSDPGYQYRLSESEKAINRAALAGSAYGSGSRFKALQKNAQELATQDYEGFLNRYYQSLRPFQSLAGVGQTALNQTGQVADNMSNIALMQGQSRASGLTDQSRIWSNLGESLSTGAGYNNITQGLADGLSSWWGNRNNGQTGNDSINNAFNYQTGGY